MFIQAEFVRISFKKFHITGVDFNASSFEKCDFEGQLNDIWFRGVLSIIIVVRQLVRCKSKIRGILVS
ncbi:hypothetical protein [Myroides injenensis]